jgi:plastocyanin/sugar lactone lactonase YvrE
MQQHLRSSLKYQKIFLLVIILVFGLMGNVFAQDEMPVIEGAEVIASGFNGPQGILVDPDGNVWVIDSGLGGEDDIEWFSPDAGALVPSKMGMTSRVVMVGPYGEQSVVAVLPSIFVGQEGIGGARLAMLDGNLYATSGQWIDGLVADRVPLMGTVVMIDDMGVTEVADLWAVEAAENADGLLLDSHPYGITAGPNGSLWVADAGANTLLRVDPESGDVNVVTAFGGLPGAFPNPARNGAIEADPVPTAVVVDADGNAYVSLLSGVPFIPGSAGVKMVAADGTVSDYAVGLTMLTDLRMGPDGQMYAVQFGIFTQEGPVPNAGAIVRVKEGGHSEIVFGGLPFPTSLDFDADGNAFVTINGLGAPGSGAVVRIDGLTGMDGEPIAMGMEMGGDMGEEMAAEVAIEDSSFTDGTITVSVGTTVTWTHIGNRPHTVTADDGSFDSDMLENGGTFSVTFDQPGTYAYYCQYHGGTGGAGMSGTVIVTE